jgi:hypothetical protein
MFGRAGKIGVAQHVAGPVDPRALAVPDPKNPIELALTAQLGLLRAPQGGRGEVLVEARLEYDVVGFEHALGALELVVEAAQRRATVSGHVTRGVEAGATIPLLLHQAHAHQRLVAGDKNTLLAEVVLVGEGNLFERHRSSLRGITKRTLLLYSGRSEWLKGRLPRSPVRDCASRA